MLKSFSIPLFFSMLIMSISLAGDAQKSWASDAASKEKDKAGVSDQLEKQKKRVRRAPALCEVSF